MTISRVTPKQATKAAALCVLCAVVENELVASKCRNPLAVSLGGKSNPNELGDIFAEILGAPSGSDPLSTKINKIKSIAERAYIKESIQQDLKMFYHLISCFDDKHVLNRCVELIARSNNPVTNMNEAFDRNEALLFSHYQLSDALAPHGDHVTAIGSSRLLSVEIKQEVQKIYDDTIAGKKPSMWNRAVAMYGARNSSVEVGSALKQSLLDNPGKMG
jgi:hypothetical protein